MEKGISSLLGVLKRRAIPALTAFAAVIGGAIAYLSVTPRLYETSTRLMLNDKRVSVSELGRDLTQVSSGSPGGASPLADQAELVKSQRVLTRAIKIFLESNKNSPYSQLTTGDLSQGLKVKIVPATNILELSYQSKDPVLGASLLNAVSLAMEEESAATIRQEAANVRKFLEKEVPTARRRLETAELNENKYRQSSGIVSFEEQTRSLVNSLASLEDQERTLATQLQEVRSRDASLRQITDAKALNNAYAAVRGGQDEQLKQLRTKLTEVENKLIEARIRFTENHPTVQGLINQRDSIRNLYVQQLQRVSPNKNISPDNVAGDDISQNLTSQLIANEIEGLAVENKLKTVQSDRANLQTRLAQLPIKQQQLTPRVRNREEAAQSLKLLQTKYEEARIAEAQQVGNISIIEKATVPTKPSSPKRSVVLVLAGVFGTILATSVVLILEVLDNTLRDASEAEELLKLPLLGVLPRLPSKTLVLEPADRFLDNVGLVEPYRMLLKNLEFRNTEKLQLIVISSTISGEGKSVVASHLAAICAMLSWRTLIIDADLRRPIQHTLFNLPPKPGITDVIEGKKTLLQAVQATDIDYLEVLTCGELHGRPSQLLESAAMKSLIAEAGEKYDLVIIDTPPVSACADAATLGRQSDGLILVTRPSFTDKEVLQKTVSELTHNQIPILGVVVNGMTDQTQKYYRYSVKGYRPLTSGSVKRLRSRGSNANNPGAR
ncbi:MAG: GumC family protein [Heteroscytonema crispum UTEX LB 1556]